MFHAKKKKVQPKQNHKEKQILNYCADDAGEVSLLQISRL